MSERNKIPVAVTGIGIVSALGPNLESTWDALERRERAIRNDREWLEEEYDRLGASAYIPKLQSSLVGRVRDFDLLSNKALAASERINPKDVDRFYSRAGQLFIEALIQAGLQANALEDNLMLPREVWDRAAVVVGTGAGGSGEVPAFSIKMAQGDKRLPPTSLPKNQPENPMIVAALLVQARGRNRTSPKACAGGNAGFVQAAELIESGSTDIAIVGGVESFSLLTLAEFESTDAASEETNPDRACLPFRALLEDDELDLGGTIVSEGAGVAIFERLDRAQARGATILGIVAGHGETSDAHDMTMLSGEGAVRSMREALDMDSDAKDMRLLHSAHGTGAGRRRAKRLGDLTEARATHEVFSGEKGDYQPEQIASRSFAWKRNMAHALGGANGIEFVLTMNAMLRGRIPPSDLDVIMPEMAAFMPTKHDGLDVEVDGFLSNGFGFGGSNASIFVKKPA